LQDQVLGRVQSPSPRRRFEYREKSSEIVPLTMMWWLTSPLTECAYAEVANLQLSLTANMSKRNQDWSYYSKRV